MLLLYFSHVHCVHDIFRYIQTVYLSILEFFLTESLFLGASTKRFAPTRYMYNNRLHMASEIPSKKVTASLCLLFLIKSYQVLLIKSFKNYEKCFLFHLKNSFRSQDIQILVFPSSPLFLPVSHCFRGWFKKSLEVFDAAICPNKNLIAHFLWYLENEIRCDIETLSIEC